MASTEKDQDVWQRRLIGAIERLVDLVLKAPLICFIIYLCWREIKRDARDEEKEDKMFTIQLEYLTATKDFYKFQRDAKERELRIEERKLEAAYVDSGKVN